MGVDDINSNDQLDYTSKYNTILSPADENAFQSWTKDQSAALERNVANDTYDYDLRGWWKQNNGGDLSGAHLTDMYKKPNHPTFSTGSIYHGTDGLNGGQWEAQPGGSWTFKPGSTNLQNFSSKDLKDYFSKVEPNNKLILPE